MLAGGPTNPSRRFMATKKKRNASGARAKVETRPEAAVSAAAEAPAAPASPTGARPAMGPVARDATPAARPGAVSLPAEVVRDDWTVIILALMMFLAPAVGVPHEEIAKMIGCSQGTVRSRLFYARQQLQAELSEFAP